MKSFCFFFFRKRRPSLIEELVAPERFLAVVDTSAGRFSIEVVRAWAPLGADRFFTLVSCGYYDDSRFFRAVAGKWVQFGIAGDPVVARAWRGRVMADDRLVQSNTRGFVAFANTGPGTRAAQVFVNLGDNSAQNDWEPGFAPFGLVVEGMEVVDRRYAGYGAGPGGGMRAGGQDPMFAEGNAWLDARFPKLDRLVRVALR
jgi:cyclophilin family peptidyl-prolyl cis-trans isomerase